MAAMDRGGRVERVWKAIVILALPVLSALGIAPGGDGLGQPVPRWLPSILGGLSAFERHAEAAGVRTRVVVVDGRLRRFHVYAPPGAGPGAPVVLALHGGSGNALRFAAAVGLQRMADAGGFVLVAPQGLGFLGRRGGWNADSRTRLGWAETRRVDDLAFLDAAARSAAAETGADGSRVYAMGVSKGGMMAYRLACAWGTRVRAIGVVAGTLSTDLCPGGAPVPLLHIHGTADENVPLAGGRGRRSAAGADWPPVMRGIELFARANGAAGAPRVERAAPDTACETWAGAEGHEVRLCLVEGGGHAWPGARPTPGQARRGVYVSPHFDATAEIGRFFAAH